MKSYFDSDTKRKIEADVEKAYVDFIYRLWEQGDVFDFKKESSEVSWEKFWESDFGLKIMQRLDNEYGPEWRQFFFLEETNEVNSQQGVEHVRSEGLQEKQKEGDNSLNA